MYGYSGRMLIADLTSKKTKIEAISEVFCRKFIGGNGFAISFLYEHQKLGIDPLSPDNVLVFAVGPFSGTVIPTSAKYVVQAKSPLTNFQGRIPFIKGEASYECIPSLADLCRGFCNTGRSDCRGSDSPR